MPTPNAGFDRFPRGASYGRFPGWSPALSSLLQTPLRRFAISIVMVITMTCILLPFREQLGVLNVLLLYLILTFVQALTAGLWPSVLSAVLGFLAFDILFIPPYSTLSVAAPDHALALFVYLGVAIATARLASRLRERTEEAVRESARATMLSELNAALITDITLDDMLARIVERVVNVYGALGSRVLVQQENGELRAAAHFPRGIGDQVDRTGQTLAEWAFEHRKPVGRSSRGRRIVSPWRPPTRPGRSSDESMHPDVLYIPIKTASRVVGVLEVIGRPGADRFRAAEEQTLMTFVDQAALALERARLSEEVANAAVLAQSDALKSALLAAVSHELRTPLASIKAASTSLLDDSISWPPEVRRDFLLAIDEETDRLTLMVSNLLDLSRIEGGALRPHKDWYDIDELLVDVKARLRTRTCDHPLTITVQDDLPSLPFDYVQIAQVLVNLIENAVKYTPAGTPVEISAQQVPGAIEISVHDNGPGIPQESQARLFDKFYRAPSVTSAPGSGIGLSISKGLVEAHGGQISVESSPADGTTFRFTLPLPPQVQETVPQPDPAVTTPREGRGE